MTIRGVPSSVGETAFCCPGIAVTRSAPATTCSHWALDMLVQPPARRSNGSAFIGHGEIEQPAVRQPERQLGRLLMQRRQIDWIDRSDAAFNLEVRRDELALELGEMLIHGQVVVDAPDARRPAVDVPFVRGLLD